jgi:V/A-type H+-transporting ATPase subunit E
MAVDDILKKITSDAEMAAQEILAEGTRDSEEILERARADAEALRKRLRAKAEQRAEEERNRVVTLARLSARRDLLSEKQLLIGKVFEETRKRILTMGRDDYRRLIKSFLLAAIESGSEEVIIGEHENRIDQAFLDEVAGEFGKSGGLRLSPERGAMDGGFILREGKTATNCTLDTILRDAQENLETEVATILFGAGS